MIFIAKNADFSANAIGKVNVSPIDDVSPSTFAILDAMGGALVRGVDDEKIIALDYFLASLDESSFKGKIKHLFIPAIGKRENLSANQTQYDCLYDIITSGKMKINYSLATGTYGSMKNTANGLIGDALAHDQQRPSIVITGISTEIERNDMHLGVFTSLQGEYSSATNKGLLHVGGEAAFNNVPTISQFYSFFDTISVRNAVSPSTDAYGGCKIMSHEYATGYTLFNLNEMAQERISEGSLSALGGDYVRIGSEKDLRNNVATGLITIGTALSAEEQTAYHEMITSLFASLVE